MELAIGENILRFRKEKGYTQEDVANALHISCAAVSKWETKASYPDITLLLPLARFFEISLDELLSFTQTLNDDEMKEIQHNCLLKFQKGDIKKACLYCENVLKEYPNCESLIFGIASLYNYQSLFHLEYEKETADQLENRAFRLLKDLSLSQDSTIAQSASIMCATIHQKHGDYQQAIDIMSSKIQPYDTSLNLVSLYHLTGEKDKSNQLLEQVIIKNLSQLTQSMSMLAHFKENESTTLEIIKNLYTLDDIFKLPTITAMASLIEIEYVATKKDKQATLIALRKYLNSFHRDQPSLYFHHLNLKSDFLEMNRIQIQFLEKEAIFDFLRDDDEFQELLLLIKKP